MTRHYVRLHVSFCTLLLSCGLVSTNCSATKPPLCLLGFALFLHTRSTTLSFLDCFAQPFPENWSTAFAAAVYVSYQPRRETRVGWLQATGAPPCERKWGDQGWQNNCQQRGSNHGSACKKRTVGIAFFCLSLPKTGLPLHPRPKIQKKGGKGKVVPSVMISYRCR